MTSMLRLIALLFFCATVGLSVHADTLSITDGRQGEKYPGKFIWTDLVSSDPQTAADFYGQLFNWQVTPYDEDYLVIRNHGRPIGGVARNQAQGDDVRTQWISYLSTSDIASAHELLMSAGAEAVLEPMTVKERGEFGIYAGPDGGVFGVLDSVDGDPEERGADLGDWIWIELWSKNPRAAADFYDELGFSVARNWASRYLELKDEARPTVDAGKVLVSEKDHKFTLHVHSDDHYWQADEPRSVGGNNTGPDPYEHLLASLGTCTAMTLRMYADRKSLPLDDVQVELRHGREYFKDCESCADETPRKIEVLEREVTLVGNLSIEQRQKLLEIADKCPVHRTLHSELHVNTRLTGN